MINIPSHIQVGLQVKPTTDNPDTPSKPDNPSSGVSIDIKQKLSSNVIANTVITIPKVLNTEVKSLPIEVLKFEPRDNTISSVINTLNNSKEDSFDKSSSLILFNDTGCTINNTSITSSNKINLSELDYIYWSL